jgi:NADPH:quinone reductase-like Zn-dependent oxidoreductase
MLTSYQVVAISTDYRDQRKGAYQEYVVAPDYNVVRLPSHISYEEGSTVGVAFVAAALGLGVSMGVDFSQVVGGPDLFTLLRDIDESRIPADVRTESLAGIRNKERPKKGDWLAVWGGEFRFYGEFGDHTI